MRCTETDTVLIRRRYNLSIIVYNKELGRTSVAMNTTTFEYTSGESEMIITAVTFVFGALIFLENLILLSVLGTVLKRLDSMHSQREIIIQSVFLSFNDGLSGFFLLFVGGIRVKDDITAFMCACASYMTVILQLMSQINIGFICAYRYRVARNIRKFEIKRKSYFTIVLTIINLTLSVSNVIIFSSTLKLRPVLEGMDFACSYNRVVSSTDDVFGSPVGYGVGTMCLFTADILCLLTIYRLKREINVAVSSSDAVQSSTTVETSSQNKTVRLTMRKQQQTAIFVVFLILVIFNLSILPIIIAGTLLYAGVYLSGVVFELALLFLYIHALLNPVIITTRILEIRKTVRNASTKVCMHVKTCFSS